MMRLGHDFQSRATYHRILDNKITDPSVDKEVHLEEMIIFTWFGRLDLRGIHLTRKYLDVATD
jgi:hypothetical protein